MARLEVSVTGIPTIRHDDMLSYYLHYFNSVHKTFGVNEWHWRVDGLHSNAGRPPRRACQVLQLGNKPRSSNDYTTTIKNYQMIVIEVLNDLLIILQMREMLLAIEEDWTRLKLKRDVDVLSQFTDRGRKVGNVYVSINMLEQYVIKNKR